MVPCAEFFFYGYIYVDVAGCALFGYFGRRVSSMQLTLSGPNLMTPTLIFKNGGVYDVR